MISKPPSFQQHQDDPFKSVDSGVLDLWGCIVAQKKMVLLVAALVALGALAFSFLISPVYQASITIFPPLLSNVQQLDGVSIKKAGVGAKVDEVDEVDEVEDPTEMAFNAFKRNIHSKMLMKGFFEDRQLLKGYLGGDIGEVGHFSEEKILNEFYGSFLIEVSPKNATYDSIKVDFLFKDKDKAASILNDFVGYVLNATRDQLVDERLSKLAAMKSQLELQVQSMQFGAKRTREDRIAKLEEALLIARQSGIVDSEINGAANDLSMEYMRGAKAIYAEIQILKNRKADDPFIEGLREIQGEVAYLALISIDPSRILPARVDMAAAIPDSPIKPKKMLIVGAAVVVGLMLGIFLVLVRGVMQKRRDQL
ncbi:Wzz/FepE/Etk N-terminal domain-containing protein [Mariprofundus sp. KV]|uniref:Wzz/FepE/Etk N-terminal domain-containing protein n=1 Tax=Mariprofundus sp. KV TaxID=2608715 RepID=UPI0015A1118B|nr:Wzz/FepE/Etk N-terminal domain-containing protein [Mariprofundus sp. KV]